MLFKVPKGLIEDAIDTANSVKEVAKNSKIIVNQAKDAINVVKSLTPEIQNNNMLFWITVVGISLLLLVFFLVVIYLLCFIYNNRRNFVLDRRITVHDNSYETSSSINSNKTVKRMT